MIRPFFSVVIPTKNRSFLIGLGIKSVLRQSFDDFEIIVADNDDTEATRPVIESFNDRRIHYYRTGGLSMSDNWEFAVSKAQGEYVTVLEDKQVLKKHALDRIAKEVKQTHYSVVGWLYDRYYDTQQPPKIVKAGGNGDTALLPSQRIIEMFIKQGRSGEFDRLFPRGLNSCIHRTLLERIRSGPAKRLCLDIAPDFSMGFQQLAYCDSILHIDEALVIVGGFSYSTGRTAKVNKAALKYLQGSDWDDDRYYSCVPVKTFTIAGFLYNDYEKIRLLVGGNLSKYPLDMHSYFMQCFNDIHTSRKGGADMSAEMAEWTRALSEQDPSFQVLVYQALLADEVAANVSLSSKVTEAISSRDKWKEKSQELEKKYKLTNLFSPLQWALSLAKLLHINIDGLVFRSRELVKYSNAFEYMLWEEMNQAS